MITEKKSANAVGGKTARACDSCLRKRARWYCAADDAFLCQGCDSSVHSANQLASRHERVQLGTSSFKETTCNTGSMTPSWHQGFTRKARTPRHGTKPMLMKLQQQQQQQSFPLVPEIGSEEGSLDDNEEQLLYRVPIFDPFDSELCNVSSEAKTVVGDDDDDRSKVLSMDCGRDERGHEILDNLHGFILPSDMDLAEFAADVESILGRGLDEDYCDIKGLGLLESTKEEDDGHGVVDVCFGNTTKRVKVENEEEEMMMMVEGGVLECLDSRLDVARETLDWDFDCELSPPAMGEEDEKVAEKATARMMVSGGCKDDELRWKMCLKLNHDAVITAWASQGSPWTTGVRPEFNPDDCWHDFMGLCPTDVQHSYGGEMGGHMGGCDRGREARVSRYREKRRTRLFSKKIRYEVRKLNAEKRPRMKGRFVKRTSTSSFAGPPPPAFTHFLNNNK